jgi:endoglucanase
MAERVRSGLFIRFLLLVLLALVAGACGGKGGDDVAGPEHTVKVVLAGTGHGRVWCPYGGIDCPTACGPVDWTPGATAPFIARADSASTFAGWSGAASGSDTTCNVVVSGHMVLTATFNLK